MTHLQTDEHQAAQDAYERGDLRRAISIIGRCLSEDRDDGRAWELFGLVHYSGGNYAKSVSGLERASLLVPLRPAGRVCLGHAYGRIGKPNLSCELLRDLINEPSLSVPLLLQVASGLGAVGRPDLSTEACRVVLSRDASVAQAHYDLGFYAGRCGRPDEMVEALARKAIDLAPEVVRYRVGLAGLLWKQDRYDDALKLICRLSNDDLVSIRCSCCLRRVINLYQWAEDYRRVVVCRQWLLHLETSGSESDCH